MMAIFRAALVIARRDYVATVWSRTFILFLIGPLFPIIFGTIFGSIGAKMNRAPQVPVIAVIADAGTGVKLQQARDRLAKSFGERAIPLLHVVTPAGPLAGQRAALLEEPGVSAVLSGVPGDAVLAGPEGALKAQGDTVQLIMEGVAPRAMPAIARIPVAQAANSDMDDDKGRVDVARGSQLVLLVLTMILTGMLLSNMIEEKSSKVIEILAAAVPVDSIFLGKLIAMLGMSLTGISVWAGLAVGGIALLLPGALTALAVPAVGWPLFILLGILYFIASYLLLGALFLGIGSQAATVREVQTLSMPITMGQLIVFALASTAVEDPSSLPSRIAMIFPWSSPFAMLASAAERAAIWPHLLAIPWQMLCVTLIIRAGSRLFRRSVLKSGSGTSLWRRLRGR